MPETSSKDSESDSLSFVYFLTLQFYLLPFFEFFESSNVFKDCTLKKKVHTAASGKSTFVICHFCSLTISISSHFIKLVNKLQLLYMKNLHRISNNGLVAVPRRSFVLDFKIGSLCCHPLTEHSLPWAASLLPYCLFHTHKSELLPTLFTLKKTLLVGCSPEVVDWYCSINLFVIRARLLPVAHSEVFSKLLAHIATTPWSCSFIFSTVYRLWMPLPAGPV